MASHLQAPESWQIIVTHTDKTTRVVMTLLKYFRLATTALAVTGTSVQAQTMKPGLWEMTNKMGGSPDMDQAMAKMQR